MRFLESLTVRSFKSIRDITLKLARLNVFVGGNGSGKSNLVGVFHFLNQIVNQELQKYTGVSGGADNILHYGRKRSPALDLALEFTSDKVSNGYRFKLIPTDKDTFIFGEERIWFHDRAEYDQPYERNLGAGHSEAMVTKSEESIAGYVRSDLERYRIFHFHDTSSSAKVKQTCDVDDNRFLRPDASNLAAFLFWMKNKHLGHYRNIEDTIRQIAPFFEGFHLEPTRLNEKKIQLEWKEKSNDAFFNAHSMSDGTLRFVCLSTLLLQPNPPNVILLDEPELGLHPAAITLLAALLESAAEKSQVLAATQSVTLVNQFTHDRIWVVDREDGASAFRHLAQDDLSSWLDGYAIGELWEKNVLGGRP
jgi:predicted ATPase